MFEEPFERRLFLSGVVGGLATVAGCGTGASESPGDSSEPTGDGRLPTASPTDVRETTDSPTPSAPTAGTATGTPTLDLREANVTAVEIEAEDGEYRFSVTLYHDDDGEDGYANWWQVETLDGRRLGRRELLHAHSTAPFTRSATVSIPSDVHCVVVRGHDQTHGYGGQAMLVALASGEARTVTQGSERQALAKTDCP